MAMPATSGFSPTEKLVAIRHANKKDFWVATVLQAQTSAAGDVGPGVLRFFRVAATGVSHAGDRPFGYPVSDVGYMKASLNGGYIAIANLSLNTVLVVPFSPLGAAIGWITSHSVTVPPFNNPGCPYGLEFSPGGKMLYYSTLYPVPWAAVSPTSDSHVFQYLLPYGPRVHLGARPNTLGIVGALQLGPDGRIYVAQAGETKIGVIAKPDTVGTGCGLTFGALPLASGSVCRLGLPNLIRDLF